ncbi:replication protein [Rhodococcus zopfii]|uniref:Replication protein n=1 Tax=Rhodococcus zopfii TaxID=43772 RepID=A0ABU3WS39_9NOCA|nr:replication protein [Rhodococcus zopfii]
MPQHTHAHPQGGIRRGPRKADNFTILSNAVLGDDRLSFRARGLLAWLLSKPADWHIRSDAIARHSPKEGRDAIRSIMRELRDAGYLVVEKHQDERGRWSTIQTIYEEPVATAPTPPTPRPGKSPAGPADNGEPGTLTRTDPPRTQTNNTSAQTATSLGDVLTAVSSSEIAREELDRNARNIAALEAATLAAGLPAAYSRIRPAQKAALLELIDQHGVDALAQAASRVHRTENPTMHVHGWIRLWQSLPVARPEISYRDRCTECEGSGFVLDDNDLAVRCACRAAAHAA